MLPEFVQGSRELCPGVRSHCSYIHRVTWSYPRAARTYPVVAVPYSVRGLIIPLSYFITLKISRYIRMLNAYIFLLLNNYRISNIRWPQDPSHHLPFHPPSGCHPPASLSVTSLQPKMMLRFCD